MRQRVALIAKIRAIESVPVIRFKVGLDGSFFFILVLLMNDIKEFNFIRKMQSTLKLETHKNIFIVLDPRKAEAAF